MHGTEVLEKLQHEVGKASPAITAVTFTVRHSALVAALAGIMGAGDLAPGPSFRRDG
jgi:hypothetical protein